MSLEAMTLDQWNKYVEESNGKFLAASRAEKRVMLAEDTLKQLKNERIVPMSKYLLFSNGSKAGETDVDLRDVMRAEAVCFVCGIGALLISAVQRLDALNSRLFYNSMDMQRDIHEYLGKHDLFTSEELNTIEYFFEHNLTNLSRAESMEIIMQEIVVTRGAPVDSDFNQRLYDRANAFVEGNTPREVV